jgi:ABC-type nitrate/sulfonate/bicarbonate transport system ATPase subunit
VSDGSAAVDVVAARAGRCVDGLSLRLGAGERVALLGENGVGKTTLLRLIAGLEAPVAGSVRTTAPVGYVAQNYRASLLPWLRVRGNIALPLRAAAASDAATSVAQQVEAAADLVGLPPSLLARFPYQLSGGEQQRVALARALVGAPRLLLLDEPLAALDVLARIALRASLRAFLEERGAALLLVTHDLDDALELAGRALVVSGGPLAVRADLEIDPGTHRALCAAIERASARGSPS